MSTLEVWFDGDCPLCRREIAVMQRLDRRGAITFIDVADGQGSCPIDRADLLARFHAREAGVMLSGPRPSPPCGAPSPFSGRWGWPRETPRC